MENSEEEKAFQKISDIEKRLEASYLEVSRRAKKIVSDALMEKEKLLKEKRGELTKAGRMFLKQNMLADEKEALRSADDYPLNKKLVEELSKRLFIELVAKEG